MTDTNVLNGKTTLSLNTNRMQAGTYNIKIKYKGTGNYSSGEITGNFTLKEFGWDTIDDWFWKKYSGTNITNITDPTESDGIINMGRANLVILSDYIPVRKDSFSLYLYIKSTYSGNRVVLGEYTTVNDQYNYTSNGLRVTFSSFSDFSDGEYHEVAYIFKDSMCSVYIDGVKTSLSKDYSNLTDFMLMFFSGKDNTLYLSDVYFENEIGYE